MGVTLEYGDVNTILSIVFVVVMLLCCGPMLFMRGKRRNGRNDAGKTSRDIEPK